MPDPNQTDPNQNLANTPTAGNVPPVIPDISNTPTVEHSTDASPFLPQTDLPPLPPDFQNAGITPAPASDSSNSQQPTASSTDSGSAAPVETFPTMVSGAPKKKFGGNKIIATILGLFLLIGGVAGGVILTQQNQNLSEKAAPAGTCTCMNTQGTNTGNGVCSGSNCNCSPNLVKSNACGETGGGGNPSQQTGAGTCAANSGIWCESNDSNGQHYAFCIPSDGSQGGCNQAAVAHGYTVTYGAKVVTCSANNVKKCFCDTSGNGSDTFNSAQSIPVCFDTTGSCTDAQGLCKVSGAATAGVYGNGTWICGANVDLSKGASCDERNGTKFSGDPAKACFCGTIQQDTPDGFKTYKSTCGCSGGGSQPTPTPSTPAITAQCQNIKAYSTTWTALTATELSALTPSTEINFCVVGSATGGSFDKAKFTINGVVQAETTTHRPTTQDFCQSYTIPAATTAFSVSAQIHHITLGYK